MDLFDDPAPGANSPEFTVTELSGAIKRVIEGEFAHVRIRGEVGRVSRPRSGHVYLDLKDDRSVISGVIWKGVTARLETQPEEGMEVITTFGGQSKYQIVIEDIKPAGMGALMALLEKRKAALAAEGLFAPERKRPLPYLPEIIGVVTSPSGAVIRDILHRLRDRFPRKVLIWPVAVQGAKCAARGGGSVEDLWGFNEEIVARAAAASEIPLISAVGHETDTTLIDFVSDKRAPTPTAAAELAVPVRHELAAWLEGQGARMRQALSQGLTRRGQRMRDLARALPRAETLTEGAGQRFDRASEKLGPALIAGVQGLRVKLADMSGALRPGTLRRQLEADRQRLAQLSARLDPAWQRNLAGQRERLGTRIDRFHPEVLQRQILRRRERLLDRTQTFRPEVLLRDLSRQDQRLNEVLARLARAGRADQDRRRRQIDALGRTLGTLGYRETLARGFAVVRGDGDVVTSAEAAKNAARLEIEFADGRLAVKGES